MSSPEIGTFHVERDNQETVGLLLFPFPGPGSRMEKMGRVVAIANQKGGVGKTTTAINLGAALAAFDRKIAIIDFDPQANATSGLGRSGQQNGANAYDVLLGADPRLALQDTGFPNLSLLPSARDLVGAEIELVNQEGRENRLRNAIESIRQEYDFVFIDCPPSLSLLTVNALTAADSVLIPLQTEYFALEGLSELMESVDRVRHSYNAGLEIEGILLTMFDERTNLARQVLADIRSHFGKLVYDTVIPRNVRLGEAPSFGKPVLAYDVKSKGAESYLALGREVLRRKEAR
jgi:chromosome partitioning protein